ncbi:hypothetical protein GQ55_3G402800 [Panicum hallii var. hallii]|uniref:Uncharacterized protein n=1 Tax=Panicum hallii var. hallii TaxID=1504633 RepID=A0A2T7EGW7_9POAL|nr:hypothetical protein GQ55_3G402800 [Panicum hallii var. hallii]
MKKLVSNWVPSSEALRFPLVTPSPTGGKGGPCSVRACEEPCWSSAMEPRRARPWSTTARPSVSRAGPWSPAGLPRVPPDLGHGTPQIYPEHHPILAMEVGTGPTRSAARARPWSPANLPHVPPPELGHGATAHRPCERCVGGEGDEREIRRGRGREMRERSV